MLLLKNFIHTVHPDCLCYSVLCLLKWELSVEKYCEEDLSIKHPWYHCCKINDNNKRLNCFSNDAPNPNYGPTQGLPVEPLPSTAEFTFNPNTCQRCVEKQKNDYQYFCSLGLKRIMHLFSVSLNKQYQG